ncbi:hypothetical protein BS78_K227800 [Paspalum vaginatum]|uniref:Uncharacterized protein n=1 Tax=Paspalum vaginatum TaxID=158149 RepID=A0A9W8CDC1_9POAL|nr:hypothetical protein BS78_K250400 [Paspalum vaginatum]KAJ1253601.1 hypothetical protein BS78_K227800 [Paspalum vaginatum]
MEGERQLYFLTVEADLGGFRALGPPKGFGDTSIGHFIGVECVWCQERSVKDVCLFVMPSGTTACTSTWTPRDLPRHCYPKCRSDAHIIKKCKSCGKLGSVEVIPFPAGEANTIALLCIGYKPTAYHPGQGWVVTTPGGDQVAVNWFTNNGGTKDFKGQNIISMEGISVKNVKFQLSKVQA